MKRLFSDGIVTTLLGIAIIGASFYMWMAEKTTQTEAFTMAGLGLVFLRSKDSILFGSKD